jgi:hypothetical protein
MRIFAQPQKIERYIPTFRFSPAKPYGHARKNAAGNSGSGSVAFLARLIVQMRRRTRVDWGAAARCAGHRRESLALKARGTSRPRPKAFDVAHLTIA